MSTKQMLKGIVKRVLLSSAQIGSNSIVTETSNTGNRSSVFVVCASALVAASAIPSLAFGQSNIEGYVYGTGKAGTAVRLENVETSAVRTATVTSSGNFRTPNVPPGKYKVTYVNDAGESTTKELLVSIGSGTSVDSAVLDSVLVTASSVRAVDLTATETVSSISSEEVNQLPVVRDIQDVAKLAPGTFSGDGGFVSQSGKPLISFGGASPGENTYYVNGFNITDFRNFLGGATIPFEFYDQFELRTGGYSAEFGRALGGVVNAVTKRGSNNFEFGAAAYWQPNNLVSKSPSVYYYDPVSAKYELRTDNSQDYNSEVEVDLHVGGPIISDRLFFYALGVFRSVRDDDAIGTTALTKTTDESPFFGGKLDWQIADNHALEYTYIHDETTTDINNFGYTAAYQRTDAKKSVGERVEGGDTHIFHYSGTLFENFTVSALYGLGERTQSTANADAVTGNPCTVVVDQRGGVSNPLSCWDSSGTGQISDTKDSRDVFRVDLTYLLGSHSLKLGLDYEENVSATKVAYEGGVAYRYNNATPGAILNGGTVPAGVTQVARTRFYNVSGDFKEKLSAVYLEDNWQATERLMLSLGLRNETLENLNKNGQEFLGFGSQLTPRLGFAFDLLGDQSTKLYGNAGRYTMPIATNTNIRFAGGEFFTEQYRTLNGVNSDGTPILGAPIGILRTLSDGSVPVPAESVDKEIKPMFQDEFILGIQSNVTDSTLLGLKVTYRNLVRAVEDSAFTDAAGNFHYFLFNPGQGVTLQNPNGTYSTISAADLGYEEATRDHWSVELTFDHKFNETFRLGGSYTWAHTYGNFEGVFNSDVQQDDAGITIAFDTPGLALYTYGDLPNDRRHNFKINGSYTPTPGLAFSFNAYAVSGRPQNARGNCPTAIDPDAYPEDCFFVRGQPTPRGSQGTLPWTYNIDLGLRYSPAWYDKLTFGVDLFNLLNGATPSRLSEVAQQGGDENAPLQPSYAAPVYFQQPLSARLSLRWDF